MVIGIPFFLAFITLRLDMIGDNGLDRCFGTAIGVRRTNRAVFGNGYHVRETGSVAIDGGRGGENDVGDIVFGH